jgi:dienelactone hydrolase
MKCILIAAYFLLAATMHVTSNAPPVLIFLGTKVHNVPVKTAELFKSRMQEVVVRCELKLFSGVGHPIYEWHKGASPLRDEILPAADFFLVSLAL